jgi:hypothetical protein
MYNKTVVAAITLLVGWLSFVASSPSDTVTSSEWVNLIAAIVTVVGVFVVSNSWLTPYAKTIMAVLAALVGWCWLVVESASGPITTVEWTQLAVGLLTAAGVYAVANRPAVQPAN